MRKLLANLQRPLTLLSVVGYLTLFGFITHQNVFVDHASAAEVSMNSLSAGDIQANTERGQGLRRAQIAMQEYAKHPREATQNCNCGPIIDQYTQGNPGQWCTMFVSWVANEAGTPMQSDKTGTWRIHRARDLMHYLQQHGTWTSASEARAKNLKPQPGDFIVYYSGDMQEARGHSHVVINTDGPDGTAAVVSANDGATIVFNGAFAYESNAGFLGFGHPLSK